MLFRFRLEELQNLIGNFVVGRQRIKIRTCWRGRRGLFEFFSSHWAVRFRLGQVERGWLGWEREAIAILEGSNILNAFFARVADFEKVGFKERNTIGEKFGQRSVEILSEWRVHRVLKDMCQFAGDFGKPRKTVARRCSAQSVRGNVQALEVLAMRLEFLQHADIFS